MGSKYRSKLEERVAEWIEPMGADYERFSLAYTIPKNYTPDFTVGFGEDCHVEVKGWFRSGDRQKYAAIAESLKGTGEILVFIFQNPGKPVSKGAKSTMGEWADKHGIPWFAANDASGFELWLEQWDNGEVTNE